MSAETTAKLEDAIAGSLATFDEEPGVVTDWIVIAAQQRVDDDGNTITSIGTLLSVDNMPFYRILGLLAHATTVYQAELGAHATRESE